MKPEDARDGIEVRRGNLTGKLSKQSNGWDVICGSCTMQSVDLSEWDSVIGSMKRTVSHESLKR